MICQLSGSGKLKNLLPIEFNLLKWPFKRWKGRSVCWAWIYATNVDFTEANKTILTVTNICLS